MEGLFVERIAAEGRKSPSVLCYRSCSVPILFVHDVTSAAMALGAAFFAETMTGAMWATPMDIAPQLAGTASGLMNCGSALAAIISPIVFGRVIDATGNWSLPFVGTMLLMAAGAAGAFFMHPERSFKSALEEHVPLGPVLEPAQRG